MKKKEYVSMWLEITPYESEDVICTSGPDDLTGLFKEEGVANDIFGD